MNKSKRTRPTGKRRRVRKSSVRRTAESIQRRDLIARESTRTHLIAINANGKLSFIMQAMLELCPHLTIAAGRHSKAGTWIHFTRDKHPRLIHNPHHAANPKRPRKLLMDAPLRSRAGAEIATPAAGGHVSEEWRTRVATMRPDVFPRDTATAPPFKERRPAPLPYKPPTHADFQEWAESSIGGKIFIAEKANESRTHKRDRERQAKHFRERKLNQKRYKKALITLDKGKI